MHEHRLYLRHNRTTFAPTLGEHPSESDLEISASSTDLTEAWREALSRMPNDLYAALKKAMDQRS
jgi:hypothetical protein